MKYTILGPDDPALAVLKAQLQNHPEWNTELKIVPWAEYQPLMEKSLDEAVSSYQAVCVPGHIWLPGLVSNNKLTAFENLVPSMDQELINAYNADDIMPRVADECKFEGKTYLLPLFTDGHLLFYRKDLLSMPTQAGEIPVINPLTLPKFLEENKNASPPYSLALKAHPSEILLDWLPYLWAAGGDLWDSENHKPLFTSKEAVDALSFYVNLRKYCPDDTHTYGNEEISHLLKTGKVIAASSWGGQAALILNEDNPYRGLYGVAVFEQPWNTSWGISIPDNQDTNTKLDLLSILYRAASPEQDRQVTWIAGSPVRKSSYTNDEMQNFSWLKAQKQMLDTCRVLPSDPLFSPYIGVLYNAVSLAFTGELSPSEALNQALSL